MTASVRSTVTRTQTRAAVLLASIVIVCSAAGASRAATATWVSQANHICTVWTAKAKAQLPSATPQTPAAAYRVSVKAVALERSELAALAKIPNPTPAGVRALASVQTDIAEIAVGLKDWQKGDKAAFARIYNKWQTDFRPHAAFIAAGAKACG